MATTDSVNLLISSMLSDELVARIAAVDPRLNVLYRPDLMPVPRYVADHHGPRRDLAQHELETWRQLLASADISFDFDWWEPEHMVRNCPRLRWVQATSAGIGQFVERTDYAMSELALTTAAGVHAVPLAEFAIMGALHFVKGVPHLNEQQARRGWERYTTRQLAGRRALVVGLGQVGVHVAQLLAALGVEVWGAGRDDHDYELPEASRIVGVSQLDEVMGEIDVLVLACPLTKETRGLISEHRLRSMRPGGVVINIARGQVIDEEALVAALADGHLSGACLDVFATEPLPEDSPLWGMPNVIVSPHSASTVETENLAIVNLFCDNLRRFLDGRPLHNLYSFADGY